MIRTIIQVAQKGKAETGIATDHPSLTVVSTGDGAIQAVNYRGLCRWASKQKSLIVMQAAVGDYVTAGQPVLTVVSKDIPPANARRRLQGQVALGVERTVEQDLAFAIRIMVDVAIKALSAAINDPTTAIQSIDHLTTVLQRLGSSPLHGRLAFPDPQGVPRLVIQGAIVGGLRDAGSH